MDRLFYFLYQYRAFFTFLVLELFCAWLVVENNQYQGARFYNSSNTVVASLNNVSQNIRDYFTLRDVNVTLADENAYLRKQLEHDNQRLQILDTLTLMDSALISRFDFVSAKVVNNQVDRFKNFITINKGEDAGLQPGMAVISSSGVVGKVKAVSNHYSVVTSLLNIEVMVSGLLKRTGHFGSIQWGGRDPDRVNFLYIPRHVKPVVGDTVVTTGYSAVFPEGIMIGTVDEVRLTDEALFYELKVKLSQDFRKLAFVTIVKSQLKHEQDSIEQIVKEMEE
jgi:rod shape-determining protein MreC